MTEDNITVPLNIEIPITTQQNKTQTTEISPTTKNDTLYRYEQLKYINKQIDDLDQMITKKISFANFNYQNLNNLHESTINIFQIIIKNLQS